MMSGLVINVLWWVTSIFVGVITALIIYARWHYGTLEKKKGLTGVVSPAFVGGSSYKMYKEIVCDTDTQNAKKYGKIYGYYEGREPQVYISDPELIKRIFVKDFDCFQNKRKFDFGHELINEMMDLLPYEKWKVVRNNVTPTLTTGKIRAMSIQMKDTILNWSARMKSKLESSPNREMKVFPKQTFAALASDVLAKCIFGTQIDALEDPDHPFVQHTRKMLQDDDEQLGLKSAIFATFPIVQSVISLLDFFSVASGSLFPKESIDYLADILKSILKRRREGSNSEKVGDFVDLLNSLLEKTESNEEFRRLNIKENTVLAQALFFLIAGFETTATTLTILSYYLSKNPSAQEKLLKEIDSYLKRNGGKIEHETLNELVYTGACMNETLRLNSPLIRIERVCNKNWKDERTGLELQKGDIVQVPLNAIHYDKEIFPEPDKFRPERFITADGKLDLPNPYAFGAFGHGPHNCIGTRFAKEVTYMAVVSIMKDFRFEPIETTQLKLRVGRTFLNSYEPFDLKICKRL